MCIYEVQPLTKYEVRNSGGKPIWCKPFDSEGFWYIDTNLGSPHAGTLMDWRDEKIRKKRFLMFSEYGVTWLAYPFEVVN